MERPIIILRQLPKDKAHFEVFVARAIVDLEKSGLSEEEIQTFLKYRYEALMYLQDYFSNTTYRKL